MATPETPNTPETPETPKPRKPRKPRNQFIPRPSLNQVDQALNISPGDPLESGNNLIAGTVNDEQRAKGQIPLTPELQQHNVLTHLSVITLSKAGMSDNMIASQTGLTHQTIGVILKNPRLQFLHSGRADVYRKALPMLLMEIATTSITSITNDDLKSLNALQRMTLSAIAIDKARLLLGESTQNVAIREYVPQLQNQVDELVRQRDQIVSLIRSRYGLESSNPIDIETLPPDVKNE